MHSSPIGRCARIALRLSVRFVAHSSGRIFLLRLKAETESRSLSALIASVDRVPIAPNSVTVTAASAEAALLFDERCSHEPPMRSCAISIRKNPGGFRIAAMIQGEP